MFVKGVVGTGIAALVALVLITTTMPPSGVHPAVLLLVFLLLYVIFIMIFIMAILVGAHFFGRPHEGDESVWRRRLRRQAYMYASVLGLAPVIGLAINSVGGITPKDVLLIIAFEAIVLFYVWKRQ